MTILDDIRAAVEATKPIQYYATSEGCERGRYLFFKEQELSPAYIMMHPVDFAEHQEELAQYCRLVHLREWKPTPEQIDQTFTKVIEGLEEAGIIPTREERMTTMKWEEPPIFGWRSWRKHE